MAIVQPLLTRTIQEVRYGATGQRLICWPEISGELVNPDASATVTIYNAAGVALVSGASASEHASYYLYYDLNASSTSTFPLACDYAAEFTFVSSGLTYVKRVLFDVVLLPLLPFCPVRVDDLKNAHSTIDAAITQASESADFAGRFILPAWVEVCQWVRAQGYRPGLISDATVLYQPTLHAALRNYWRARIQEPGDVAGQLVEQHGKSYADALDRVVLKWDPSQSRAVETTRGLAQPRLLIGPDYLPSGDNGGRQ